MTTTIPERTSAPVADIDIVVNQAELLAALRFVTSFTPTESRHLAVLQGVHLEAGSGRLVVSRFNYEVAARQEIAAKGSGQALIGAFTLLDIIKDLPKDAELILSVEKNKLIVVGDGVTYRLSLLPIEDYPALPAPGSTAVATLTPEHVARLTDVAKAAGIDQTLPVLTGIAFARNAAGTLDVAATDRYRLAVLDTGLPVTEEKKLVLLVPAKLVTLISKHFKGESVALSYDSGNPMATFAAGTRSVTTRLVDGGSPDYARLMVDLDSLPTRFTAAPAPMVTAVKQVAKVGAKTTPVALNLSSDGLRFSVKEGDESSATKLVPGAVSGEADSAANVGYLLDGLNTVGGTVTFRFREGDEARSKPMLLLDEDRPEFRYLLMPVKRAA